MKEVLAVIRRTTLPETKAALVEVGYKALTYQSVEGRGKQRGFLGESDPTLAPESDEATFQPKRLVTLLVPDQDVGKVVAAIIRVNQTGYPGDGKIFITPLDEVWRVRTGEAGEAAIG